MSYELNITEVKKVLEKSFKMKEPVLIMGMSGLGKSEAVKQFSERFKDGMIEVRLVDKEPTDVGGVLVPTMVDGKMVSVWATANVWPKSEDWEGVVFLDELPNSSPAVQAAAYQIALDGKINDYVFPEGAFIVAAGNRAEDGGMSHEVLAPLLNRFTVVTVVPDLEQWVEDYAPYNNIHPVIVQYLKANPDDFFTYSRKADQENEPFATARSWSRKVSPLLHQCDNAGGLDEIDKAMIAGSIGSEIVPGLTEMYHDLNCLPEINLILEGRLKEFEFQNASYIFASAYAGLAKILSTIKEDDVEVVSKKVANYVNFFLDNKNVGHNTDLCVGMVVKLMKKTTEISPSIYQHITNECKDIMGAVEEYKQLLAA